MTVRTAWAALARRRGAVSAWLYPIEIPVTYIVGLSFVLGVSPYAAFRSVIVALAITVVLMCLFTLVLRDAHRAGIAMLVIYLLGISASAVILLLYVVPVIVVVVLLDRMPRRRVSWAAVSRGLSTFMSILLVIVVIESALSGRLGRAVGDLAQGGGLPPSSTADPIDPAKPDIYVIILDGYARPDVLRESFGFDDGPFLSQLETRGFDVASNSHSNYPVTAQTLVTMFNMDYLDQIPEVAELRTGDPAMDGQYRHAINHNQAFDLLRGQGYQIVATGSGWEQLALRQADVYLDGGQLNTFEVSILRGLGLGVLIQHLAPGWAAGQVRDRLDGSFEQLRRVAGTPSGRPRLVISHVLEPHPPIVYGPSGEHLSIELTHAFDVDWIGGATDQKMRDGYVGQLQYVNAHVLPVVDEIVSSARRPTVVILMSDHGSRLDTAAGTDLMSPEADDNFFATLTPGHEGLFGDSPTPVNLFPQVLNAYLGTDLPIRPDKSFISRWGSPMDVLPLPTETP